VQIAQTQYRLANSSATKKHRGLCGAAFSMKASTLDAAALQAHMRKHYSENSRSTNGLRKTAALPLHQNMPAVFSCCATKGSCAKNIF